jgi:hypothetical protein
MGATTIAGLVIAAIGIIGGFIVEGGAIGSLINLPGFMIVIVGRKEELLDHVRALETERMTALVAIEMATGIAADRATVSAIAARLPSGPATAYRWWASSGSATCSSTSSGAPRRIRPGSTRHARHRCGWRNSRWASPATMA